MVSTPARLRPVARVDGEWMVYALLREAWPAASPAPSAWMLWCPGCHRVIEGTALQGSGGLDLDDLLPRWVREWEAACRERTRQKRPQTAGRVK